MDFFAVVRLSVLSMLLVPLIRPSYLVAIWQQPCPVKISLKVSERDKHKMHETYQSAWHTQENNRETCWDDLHPSEKLPPLKHSETDTDGWEDFDLPVLYFYGGLIPYVGRYVSVLLFRHCLALGPSPPYQGLTSVAVGTTERRVDRHCDPRADFRVEFSGSNGRSSPRWSVLDRNSERETFLPSRVDRP